MPTIEFTDEQVLALARVILPTTAAQAGAHVEDGEQFTQWREARKIITDEATSIIHASRSARR